MQDIRARSVLPVLKGKFMSKRILWSILLSGLIGPAGAQSIIGTNIGPIPDGTAIGPEKYGAPREIRFQSADSGTVQTVEVQFDANHPFVGDLKATLISPQGIEHRLFERTGATSVGSAGSGNDLVSSARHSFRDSHVDNWWTVVATGNPVIPPSDVRTVISGPTTPPPATTSINDTFLDRPAAGTWILRFEDGWLGDTGDVTFAGIVLTRLATTRIVTKVDDTNDGVCDSDCSLREAIAVATPGQQITFGPAFNVSRVIFLESELTINKNLSITGPGPHRLGISAAGRSRVFRLTGSRITISSLRIADGVGDDAGCVSAQGTALVLHRVEIGNCRAAGSGIERAGGLLQIGGSLLMTETSVVGNHAINGRAGGVAVDGTIRMVRSTISGNLNVTDAIDTAGGILTSNAFVVIDSTITANLLRGSGIEQGAGVSRSGSGVVSFRNSVVAGNSGGSADIFLFGGAAVSHGYNAIGRIGDLASVFDEPGDQTGVDPLLSPLGYHGSTLPVHVPMPRSPLLDKGLSFRSADVRGVPVVSVNVAPAPGGNLADIGAVELSPITVLTLGASGPGTLRQALLDAPPPPAVTDIVFDPALTRLPATLPFLGQFTIDRNVSIHGPGADQLTLTANRQSRVFAVTPERLVGISGLTLADGDGTGTPNSGEGGVLFVAPGAHVGVIDSVIRGGRSNLGSAIGNRGSLWLRGSTVTANRSPANVAVIHGGADSMTRIDTSTLSGNSGTSLGLLNARAAVHRSTIHANANPGFSAVNPVGSAVLFAGSIVAGQRSGNDLGGSGYLSGGHNLIGTVGANTAFVETGDQVPSAGVLDPDLSPLAQYSGRVPVHVPRGRSRALDAGVARIRDQRGLPLFDLAGVPAASGGEEGDIGAVETQALLVDNAGDSGPGTLRQAMLDANGNGPGTDDIVFVNFSGTITLTGALPTLTGATNLIGPEGSVTVSRNPSAPTFGLFSAAGTAQFDQIPVGISSMKLTNGSSNAGGAIDTLRVALHLTDVEAFGNTAIEGGALNIVDGNAVIRNSTFVGNSATNGGALRIRSKVNRVLVEQSTFSGNSASSGGAIDFGADGANGVADLEVFSSTIASNTAGIGGGIVTATRAGALDSRTQLRNTILSGNSNGNLVLNNGNGAGSVVSQGFNLSHVTEPLLDAGTDLTAATAGLAPLAANGGAVRTHLLQSVSAAIDAGLSTALLFDPRGQQRLQVLIGVPSNFHDGSDIGAVEMDALASTPEIFRNGFE